HEAGLVHGRLEPVHVLLTGEGILKVCGFGEPPWLAGSADVTEDSAGDLAALGRIAAGWCDGGAKRKGGKAKSLADVLQAILERLNAADAEARYPSAAALLEALDGASADVPANAEAWDRLLKHVRENAVPEAALRETA